MRGNGVAHIGMFTVNPRMCHIGVMDPAKRSGGRHGMIFGHVQPLPQITTAAIIQTVGDAPLVGAGKRPVHSETLGCLLGCAYLLTRPRLYS